MGIMLLIFFLFILGTVYLVSEEKLTKNATLVLILFFAFTIWYYIRFGFGRCFTSFDESYYASLLGDRYWYSNWPISGFVTPFLLHKLNNIISDPIITTLTFSALVFLIYAIFLYWFYKKMGLDEKASLFSLLVLFMSSYYIWPALEVRPQQLGFIVGASLFPVLNSKQRRMLIPILFVLLVLTHVLSFIVFSTLLLAYIVLEVAIKGKNLKTEFLTVSLSILLGWVAFLLFPPYNKMTSSLVWVVENTKIIGKVPVWGHFSIVSTVLLVLGLYIIFRIIDFAIKRLETLRSLWEIITVIVERFKPYVLGLSFVLVLIGLYLQFKLRANIYATIYANSALVFFLLQFGNLFFAVVYIREIMNKVSKNAFQTLDTISIILVFIGGLGLFASLLMPSSGGWSFNNWLIRIVQYFIPFATPTVALSIMRDLRETTPKFKPLITITLSLLIFLSALNVARPPRLYNYELTWDEETIDVIKKAKFNTFLGFRAIPSDFKKVSVENLLRAYGRLSSDYVAQGPILLSSDNYYILSAPFTPMKLGEIKKYQDLYIVPSSPIEEYYAYLILYEYSLIKTDKCSGISPLLIIGGPLSNKCAEQLEEERATLVSFSENGLVSPRSRYPYPQPGKDWWDIKNGLFVIQSIEHKGDLIILIEGTNVDSTIAGIYYFENFVSKAGTYSKCSYIIGEWREKDSQVWNKLKFNSEDKNGFSEGDEIKILEVGCSG